MFHDIVEPSIRVGSRKAYVLPLSIVTHVVLLAIIVIVPLMATDVLPIPATTLMAFVSGDVPLPSPPSPPPIHKSAEQKPVVDLHPNAAPVEAPGTIAPESAVDPLPVPAVGTVDGMEGGLQEMLESLAPAPSAPPPAPAVEPRHVGGNIRPPTKLKEVRPVYPPIAVAGRIEGVVIIETTIGPTGKVMDAKILRSVPLLDAAALDAVRQWEFTPTLLNGNPIPVVMTVTVTFALR